MFDRFLIVLERADESLRAAGFARRADRRGRRRAALAARVYLLNLLRRQPRWWASFLRHYAGVTTP